MEAFRFFSITNASKIFYIFKLHHLYGSTFAFLLGQDYSLYFKYGHHKYPLLTIVDIATKKILMAETEIEDALPFGSDPITGENRMLLCHSASQVFILDTRTFRKTIIFENKEDQIIRSICTNSFEGSLIIGVC